VAYSSDINSTKEFNEELSTYHYSQIKGEIIKVSVDYDTFISKITKNDSNAYTFEYILDTDNIGHWQSDSFNFKPDIQWSGINYYPISTIGISTTDSEGNAYSSYEVGDKITIRLVYSSEISMYQLYSAFTKLGLYIDEDGDVCQYD